MNYIQLPLYSDSEMYRYSTTIEDDSKQFTFRWNTRTGTWHMDIHNEDQTEVILGVALISQYPILADHSLEESGINGYFLLIPINSSRSSTITSSYTELAEFFNFYYAYPE